MLAKDFDILLGRRLGLIHTVLASKATEYASTDDQLHNFKKAAKLQDSSATQVLLGMLAKHLVSVIDKVNSIHRQLKNRSTKKLVTVSITSFCLKLFGLSSYRR